MLKRVFQTAMALGLGQMLQILGQWCLPPVFLASYGVDGFASWLLLTAAVSHLNTLDFGLQTFLINELTLLRQRGEMDRFQSLQSVGLRLSLGLMSLGCVFCLGVWLIPVERWMRASLSTGIKGALCLLGLQMLGLILFGQMSGLFRVMGHPRLGAHWQNAQRAVNLGVTAMLAWSGKSFWMIAAGQLISLAGVFLSMMVVLSRAFPEALPRWGRWDRNEALRMTRQSAFFGLFSINQLLVFQLPLILLAQFGDATAVVTFSTARTLFSSARQISNVALAALSPELTRLMGLRDRAGLARAYQWAEPLLYGLSLMGGAVVFVLSPAVVGFWLRRPELFQPGFFALMFAASLCMQVKELKLYFQHATNEHVRTAAFTTATYALMLLWGPLALLFGGSSSLIAGWIATEIVQGLFIHRCNSRLMGANGRLEWMSTMKMWSACGAVSLFFSSPIAETVTLNRMEQWGAALSFCLLAGVCVFLLFRGPHFLRELWRRFRPTPIPATTTFLHLQ
ncbi:MAG: hypothetical protein HY299_19000 [Verrucomicrobia bacterium]|nr:hypothetical protein [Verrucomicrobiota bacterium]